MDAMRAVYADLPGVKVEPLRFTSADISGERLLAMMKVDDSESKLLNSPSHKSFHAHSNMIIDTRNAPLHGGHHEPPSRHGSLQLQKVSRDARTTKPE